MNLPLCPGAALLVLALACTASGQGLGADAARADLGRLSPAAALLTEAFLDGPGANFAIGVDPRTQAVRRLRGTATEVIPAQLSEDESTYAQNLGDAFIARFGGIFGVAELSGALVRQDAFASKAAYHARYRQSIDGVSVVDAYLNLHFDLGGRLVAADSTLSTFKPAGDWTSDRDAAVATVRARSKATGSLPDAADGVEAMWFSSITGQLLPVYRVVTSSNWPMGVYEGYVDAQSGELIDSRNLLCTATGSGLVFDPNPVIALSDPTLTDSGDSCYARMMTARTSVMLERLDGSGFLTGDWVSTSASAVARTNEPSLVYNYCRDTSFFSEVMVYFHLDRSQAWIQSLGFTNINNRQQVCDPYRTCGAPNAYYDPSTRRITFCRDGIDSSEDADVIVHEYGHSIHDNQVPGWGSCEEGRAMGEGFGDYFAESANTQGLGSFQYGDLGDWFGVQTGGTGSGTGLRTVLSSKIYPRDYVGEVHADGEIWCAGLWDIRESLGRSITDSLVLQSHFFLSTGADFMDGGDAIIRADQLLFAGANATVIEAALRSRGLYFAQDGFEPNGTAGTAKPLFCGGNPNLVVASGDTDWYTFEVRGAGGWLTFYHHAVSPSGSTTCIVPYDIDVYNPTGGVVPTTGVGGTNQFVNLAGATTGTYQVRVRGNSGARFAYDLDYVEVNDGSGGFVGLCGDCNNDGLRNIIDALTGAQSGAGLILPPNPAACDVDSSTSVTIIDSLLMAQYAAGLPVVLSCAGGVCGQGSARDITCGGMQSDSMSVGSGLPPREALATPGTTHFYRLSEIPAGANSITISTTGTGDIDMVIARPGSLPGSTQLTRYPTSTQMESAGPTATESITLNGGTIYTPASFAGGPLSFAITAFTPGSYTVTVTCN